MWSSIVSVLDHCIFISCDESQQKHRLGKVSELKAGAGDTVTDDPQQC